MSIVKMKHLRVFGMASHREELLRELQRLGCVELTDAGDKLADPAWKTLTRIDDGRLAQTKGALANLNAALGVLGKYAKEKGTLLARRPVLTEQVLFDGETRRQSLEVAEELLGAEKTIAALYSELSKLRGQRLTLAPFLELDVPLDEPSTDEISVTFGSVPLKKPRSAPEASLEETLKGITDLVEVTLAGRDQEVQSLLVICHRTAEEAVLEALKGYGFARSTLRDWTGTAKENDEKLTVRMAELEGELAAEKSVIVAKAPQRDALRLAIDRVTQELHREEAKGKLLESAAVFFFEGWVPAPDLAELEGLLGEYVCCWETEDPVEDEYPQVPVKLKSNVLTRPMNMVT
ncbi:MAG: V-type ATP synthase subunit I, partial [Oscillospiraceae bacterium]